MICVPISKVIPKGMSMGPNFEIFWTSSKFDVSKIFFSKFIISCVKKIVGGGINGLSINKDIDEVQNFSKFGPMNMPLQGPGPRALGSTFEISTKIILLQIDGFLQRLDLEYHPS